MLKYNNRKVTVCGVTFDSVREARRYRELELLSRAGEIADLRRQVKYTLIPAQYEDVPTGELYKTGVKKGTPKIKRICIEREVDYVADFVYTDKGGNKIVEDTKGVRTKDYIIKRKLMLYIHDIRVREV